MSFNASFNESNNRGIQVGQYVKNVENVENVERLERHSHNGSSEESQVQACLRDLRITNPRDDKTRIERFKGGLLYNSYCWVLENDIFKQWRDNNGDGGPQDRLLWIRADPGKEKTMLLCGIASDPRLKNATAVLRGLIFSLLGERPALISHIQPRYSKEGRDLFEDVNAWNALKEIFIKILEDASLPSIILMLDALGECNTDLLQLLELVRRSTANPRVKWVVSSRNWRIIEQHLTESDSSALSLELNERFVAGAVRSYIQAKVDVLAQLNDYDESTRAFTRRYLMENAHDTFLWVALVCHGDSDNIPGEPESKFWPPSSLSIGLPAQQRPGEDNQNLENLIKLCGSFLTLRGDTIFFVHHSAKEFLLKCDLALPSGRRNLADRSIEIMSQTLWRNIYNIERRGCQLEEVLSPSPDPLSQTRYACVYWIDHLDHLLVDSANGGAGLPDLGPAQWFFEHKLLHWLEAASLLGQLSGILVGLQKLESTLQLGPIARPSYSARVKAWSGICTRKKKQAGFSGSPPTKRSGALAFIQSRQAMKFSPLLTGHSMEPILAVRKDFTVSSWDSRSGKYVSTINLERVPGYMATETLSLNKDLLTSIYTATTDSGQRTDSKICIWDLTTGKLLWVQEKPSKVYWDDSSCYSNIQWLNDGKGPASQYGPQTLVLDFIGTEHRLISRPGDRISISHFCDPDASWTQDGSRVVFSLNEYKLAICDGHTGSVLQVLKSNRKRVRKTSWSADGSMLASMTGEGFSVWTSSLHIWDPETGKLCRELKGEHMNIQTIAWSHDGDRIASATRSGTVQVWNARTGACLHEFDTSMRYIEQLAWSFDGNRLATRNFRQFRIWDTSPSRNAPGLQEHRDSVRSILRTARSNILSSMSSKYQRILNPGMNQKTSGHERHPGEPDSVYWSPDGTRLASYKTYEDVRIWDARTGCYACALGGPSTSFVEDTIIAWSSNEMSSYGPTSLGHLMGPVLQYYQKRFPNPALVHQLAWSHDGRRIVIAFSREPTLTVWDLPTGQSTNYTPISDVEKGLSAEGLRLGTLWYLWFNCYQFANSTIFDIWDLIVSQYLNSVDPSIGLYTTARIPSATEAGKDQGKDKEQQQQHGFHFRFMEQLLCMGNVTSRDRAQLFWGTWYALDAAVREALVCSLNRDGRMGEPAVQPTYMPALLGRIRDERALSCALRYLCRVMTATDVGDLSVVVIERSVLGVLKQYVENGLFDEDPTILEKVDVPKGVVVQRE
ncbi:hypothetical protein BO71DRAFT_438788 [Aspergillus ellipticus CBS 707.79]|uniref:Uncharacterized protein n=1 Tax=Aspergillus ellipticus CBS 707.79 TaxID=1448320 RepID=A0A319DLA1_9EURO|nr:hypothetical protein BO71DRAFT_438788 [Aspergillus ellipticus CBS 707.79]